MKLAIYGCWKGHSTKREVEESGIIYPEVPCGAVDCKEEAKLFSVIDKKAPNPFKVVLGGKQ